MKFSSKGIAGGLAIVAVLMSVAVSAQDVENLVPNGSFESVDKKPKRLGKIESATGWVSPTGIRADLFVDTKIEDIAVPYNIYGKEEAKDGTNYAGIVGFSYGDKMARSYLMTKLSAPMKKGTKYCVKVNISLAEASKYASNNIGAIFSKKAFGTDSKISIIEDVSLLHWENEITTFTGRYNWTEICGMYTAQGGEKYITIGNFDSNEDTRNERMKKDPKQKDIKVSQIIAAYYYIDDVSVVLVDTEKGEECDCASDGAGEDFSTLIYQRLFTPEDNATQEDIVQMQQVYFAMGKSQLTTEGEQSLDLVAEYLKANPSQKVQLLGHENAAEEELGLEKDIYADLDIKRIGTVMTYLMEAGIEESRMIATAKGSETRNEQEMSEADDEELKQAKDRRVEFVLR